MASRDIASLIVNYEKSLLELLEKDPDNRMAFDFLMAHYLRAARPEKVVANLHRLERFEYRGLPRHFQEAIVVHASRTGGKLPSTERRVTPETLMRAATFTELLASSASREEAMQRAVEAGLGDSYFFYHSFGVSGL